jgi:hypothetical protein
VEKATSNFLFFLYRAQVQQYDFWGILQQKDQERDSCSQVYLTCMEIFIW